MFSTPPNPRLATFTAASSGTWQIRSMLSISGEPLPAASYLTVNGTPSTPLWSLRGVTSNERYVTEAEKKELVARQEGLGRPGSTYAALIPIQKTEAWWQLTASERRAIFEEQSHHTQIGLRYLPSIVRRLHHCRDLSTSEPFDFLTWFEYRPEDEPAFDQLVSELRQTPEWKFVCREIDIRLTLS